VLVWAVLFWPGWGPSVCPLQEDLRWREQLTAVTGPVNQDIHPPLERQVMLCWCHPGAVWETHQHSERQIIGKAPSAQCFPCISGHVICMPWCLQSVASCDCSITHVACPAGCHLLLLLKGPLWDWYRQLHQEGWSLDSNSYSTCFR